jgi:hypothetical protein
LQETKKTTSKKKSSKMAHAAAVAAAGMSQSSVPDGEDSLHMAAQNKMLTSMPLPKEGEDILPASTLDNIRISDAILNSPGEGRPTFDQLLNMPSDPAAGGLPTMRFTPKLLPSVNGETSLADISGGDSAIGYVDNVENERPLSRKEIVDELHGAMDEMD